jgi:hypothetical protein
MESKKQVKKVVKVRGQVGTERYAEEEAAMDQFLIDGFIDIFLMQTILFLNGVHEVYVKRRSKISVAWYITF